MESISLKQENTHTLFVQLNIYACKGCWECIKVCPNKVIDRSFLFIASTLIHKQVLMYDAEECTGCLRCMEACRFDAIIVYNQ